MKCLIGSILATMSLVSNGAQFIVGVKISKMEQSERESLKRIPHAALFQRSGFLQFSAVGIRSIDSARRYISQYVQLRNISYLVRNQKIYSNPLLIGDPGLGNQWFHARIGSKKAWEVSSGSSHVVTAVLDTGVDYFHPELHDAMLRNTKEIPNNGIDDDHNGLVDDDYGFDFVGNDGDPMDETSFFNPGEGTHSAALIAGKNDNDFGGSGIAPGSKILAVRVLDSEGTGTVAGAVRGIDYAIERGAKIIVAGWTSNITKAESLPIEDAVKRAEAAGVVVVIAAGNDGRSNDGRSIFPVNTLFSNVISVASTNQLDQKPIWSNYGENSVDLSAPGENIYSALPDGNFGRVSGSSMSASIVAGVAALIRSKNDFSPAEVRSIIQLSGTPVVIPTQCQCQVNAGNSMQAMPGFIFPAFLTIKVGAKQPFAISGSSGKIVVSDSRVAEIDGTGMLIAKRPGIVKLSTSEQSSVRQATVKIIR